MDNEKLFAIDLADNEKRTRDLALKKIKNYIRTKTQPTSSSGGFNEDEMVKIWKGLHYSMWMCDKLIVQVIN
jgi:ribosomal RNA-processing protein 1